jgi:hypothetical protein
MTDAEREAATVLHAAVAKSAAKRAVEFLTRAHDFDFGCFQPGF